ncbi:DUF6188 family protein [Alkalisalibacterium limincola]|uniref:DUF6188 family protein n=1 Tax=Alkalisalibacterium limincola TaxID=2699169 RepID=UPI003CCD1B28
MVAWEQLLIGRKVTLVESWEGCPCVLHLTDGYRLQIESLWRLRRDGIVVLTSHDDGHSFAAPASGNAIEKLCAALVGLELQHVSAHSGTSDLTLEMGRAALQVVSDSSGYEAWQAEGPDGTLAVGQGGGNVVVWN